MVRKTAIKFGVFLVSAIVMMTFMGTGTAFAKDPFVGLTYKDASGKISQRGGTPVISTVVGSQLATDECIVLSWHRASYAEDDNFDHDRKKFMLALNCTAKLAHAGMPGNSLASEEGRAQRAIEARAERFNSKPSRCAQSIESCKTFCDKYGLCSKEVLALF